MAEHPKQPKLLYLSQTLPWPLDGGGWIRTYHTLKLLSQCFDVTMLAFGRSGANARRDGYDFDAAVAELRRFGVIEAFPVPQNESRVREAWDHFRSLALRKVYTHFMYDSKPFRDRLEAVLETGGFDIVHVNTLDMAAYLPACERVPVVCGHLDVESLLWRRRSRFEGGLLKRRYFAYQAERRDAEERYWADRVALNVMVSDADLAILREMAPRGRYAVVPNGVDVDEYEPAAGDERGVAYIGGTNWMPNLDALQWFSTEILPELRALGADPPVRWVGSASDEEKRQYRDQHGIELTGYVDDVRPYMRDSVCNIVPLRSGGGTRVKILNAWAMGKAIVSTSIGCEGLEAVDGENILVRDEPAAFARAIVDLERDVQLRQRLGAGARRTAEQIYSWAVIGREMNQIYLDLVR